MIATIEENLRKGIKLLNHITDEQYSNSSVAPYNASIGGHTRHILDVFNCLFLGLDKQVVDLTNRERNKTIEISTAEGVRYYEEVIVKLNSIQKDDLTMMIQVTDDIGGVVVSHQSSLGALLMQIQSHTTHHFASLGYILNQIGVVLPDNDFGYNPTTPIETNNLTKA